MSAAPKPKAWYTQAEVAACLHRSRRQVRRMIRPHRKHCHLARENGHPRLVLWVPAAVLRELVTQRPWFVADVPKARQGQST